MPQEPVPVSDDMRDPDTPDEVHITSQPRAPVSDATLGIPVAVERDGTPVHRLVVIGDSLSHGFQSGAVYNTQISWPAIVAWELGWFSNYRFPVYHGTGGLPMNIEWLVRRLEHEFGLHINVLELAVAAIRVGQMLDEVEDWWERGPGAQAPIPPLINHDLAVYGWDLRDALSLTADLLLRDITSPEDDWLAWRQGVQNAGARAAYRVLGTARDPLPEHALSLADGSPPKGRALTAFEAAAVLGGAGSQESGQGDGIETLAVLLGANNALQAVTDLRVAWSGDGYDKLGVKNRFTVWRPSHFSAELAQVGDQVRRIRARHVIWGTVPHVTIAPIARGVGTKVRPDSRYFPSYTRPWISDADFDQASDPHITAAQARAVDSAIDQYNEAIVDMALAARNDGLDWYVLDVAGLMDRLAARRYIESPATRPPWWTPYSLPAALAALDPPPDSRFFAAGAAGRARGGLFSLDGVHPTTVCYGILAQEFINVMAQAGVSFFDAHGRRRPDTVEVDFKRLLALDTLISDPPRSVSNDLHLIGWLDQHLGWLVGMLKGAKRPAGTWPVPVTGVRR